MKSRIMSNWHQTVIQNTVGVGDAVVLADGLKNWGLSSESPQKCLPRHPPTRGALLKLYSLPLLLLPASGFRV